MASIKVGNFLYNTQELPFTAKVLSILCKRTNGASFMTIADQSEIKRDFNGDGERASGKVKVALSNLRLRGVVGEVQNGNHLPVFKILNKDEALTLISEGAKIAESVTQRMAEAAKDTIGSAMSSNSNPNKVKTMSTKKAPKAPRLFLNPETSKVEPFGIGRPSKVKLACEVSADGKYLNAAAAIAFIENGGKGEDKLTKTELLDLLRKVRAERDAAVEAVEALMAGIADEIEDSADAESVDSDDDLDLEAEAVDSDDDSAEAEAA